MEQGGEENLEAERKRGTSERLIIYLKEVKFEEGRKVAPKLFNGEQRLQVCNRPVAR